MRSDFYKSFLFILIILLSSANSIFSLNSKHGESSVDKIEKEFINKQIDVDTWARLTCFALYDYKNLPLKYRSQYQDRSSTMAVKLLFERWNRLSEATKMSLSIYGFNSFGVMSRPANLNSFVDTQHFRIHYSVAQGDTNAVANWDFNYNGVPDYIDKITDAFEHSWVMEIDSFMFYQPPSDTVNGGNDKYDIYVTKFSNRTYGITYKEQLSFDNPNSTVIENNAATSYIVVRNEYNNYSAGETGSIDVTAAHEFFHAIQFGYDSKEKAWLMESTAAWVEDEVYDDVNDNRQYLKEIFYTPEKPINLNSSPHWYGSWLFFKYLSEQYGGPLVINEIWDKSVKYNSANDDYSWTAVSEGLIGMNVDWHDAFTNFWIAVLLKNYLEYSFEEGDYYPPVVISSVFWNTSSSYEKSQKQKSAIYYRFTQAFNLSGNDKITITFTPKSSDLAIIFIKKSGTQYTIDKYPSISSIIPVYYDINSNYDMIYAIVINDGDYTKDYNLKVTSSSSAKISKLNDNTYYLSGFLNTKQHYFYPSYPLNGNNKTFTKINFFLLPENISAQGQLEDSYSLFGAKNYDDYLLMGSNIYGSHDFYLNKIATDWNDTSSKYTHFGNYSDIIIGDNYAEINAEKKINSGNSQYAIWCINLTTGETDPLIEWDNQNQSVYGIRGSFDNFIYFKDTNGNPKKTEIMLYSFFGQYPLITTFEGQGILIDDVAFDDATFAWIQYVDSLNGLQLQIENITNNHILYEQDESDGNKIDLYSLETIKDKVIWAKFKGTTTNPHFRIYYFDGTTTKMIRNTNNFVMQQYVGGRRFSTDVFGLAWMELETASPTNYFFYYLRLSDGKIFSTDMSNLFGREPHLDFKISKDYAIFEVNDNQGNVNKRGIYLLKISDIITGLNNITQITPINNYKLTQNYPNPFNPSTTISYQIPVPGKVTLKIYDILGREVTTLVNEEQSAGNYKVTFDASRFASGVYLYRIFAKGKTKNFVQTKKMVLLK